MVKKRGQRARKLSDVFRAGVRSRGFGGTGLSRRDASPNPLSAANVEHNILLIVDDVSLAIELIQDASRSSHDHYRQFRVHAERRLPADALRRAGRRRPHYLRNQMRLKSREHSGRDDHGRESVRVFEVL